MLWCFPYFDLGGGGKDADAAGGRREGAAEEAYRRAVDATAARAGGNAGAGKSADAAPRAGRAAPAGEGPTPVRLHVRCEGGAGFAGALAASGGDAHTLALHVLLREHRARSRTVPLAVEPRFSFTCALDLGARVNTRGLDAAGGASAFRRVLEAALPPLTVVVTSHRGDAASTSQAAVVGIAHVEWAPVLAAGTAAVDVQLRGVGAEAGLRTGTLRVELEVTPAPLAGGRVALGADEAASALSRQRMRETSASARFLSYARSWWAAYAAAADPGVAECVRLLLPEASGAQRACVSTVRPQQAGRSIASPREAARFVSLIPAGEEERERRRGAAAMGNALAFEPTWAGAALVFAQGWASRLDHATLLCSLLLGFNLDAWVVLGRDATGPHAWVAVRDSRRRAIFWESLTGRRYDTADPKAMRRCPYRAVGCAFNHRKFFASLASSSLSSGEVDYRFEDPALWMGMDEGECAALPPPPPLALRPPTADRAALEEAIESALRQRIAKARSDAGMRRTVWDLSLSYLLMPALASYEGEQITGASGGNEEFQMSIKRAVPRGYSFKAFPQQFTHTSADRMLSRLLTSEVCADIIGCDDTDAKFALRARCCCYPEDVFAVWVMVSVCHHNKH
eukprot:PRCOL_00005635-RA